MGSTLVGAWWYGYLNGASNMEKSHFNPFNQTIILIDLKWANLEMET